MPDSNTLTSVGDANVAGHHAVVVGAGFLGRAVIRALFAAGAKVTGTTRTEEDAARILSMGAEHRVLHLTRGIRQSAVTRTLSDADFIVYSVAAGDEGQTLAFRDGLLAVAQATNVPIVIVSSTSVYDADDGHWVDETSPTAGLLAASERLLWARPHTAIVRCGGLYGDGRTPLSWVTNPKHRERVSLANPAAWMSWVHVDDAANAVVLALSHGEGPFNVAHAPVTRQDFYDTACTLAGVPFLTFDKPGPGLGKRCSTVRATSMLGWRPAYPTHAEGLRAATIAVVE